MNKKAISGIILALIVLAGIGAGWLIINNSIKNNSYINCLNSTNGNITNCSNLISPATNHPQANLFCSNTIPIKVYYEYSDIKQTEITGEERLMQVWYKEDANSIYYKEYNNIGGSSIEILNKNTGQEQNYRIYPAPDYECFNEKTFQGPHFGMVYSNGIFNQKNTMNRTINGFDCQEYTTKISGSTTKTCISKEYCMQIEQHGLIGEPAEYDDKIQSISRQNFSDDVFALPANCLK